MAKLDYDALNSMTRYMMISVFAVQPEALPPDEATRAKIADETGQETYNSAMEELGKLARHFPQA